MGGLWTFFKKKKLQFVWPEHTRAFEKRLTYQWHSERELTTLWQISSSWLQWNGLEAGWVTTQYHKNGTCLSCSLFTVQWELKALCFDRKYRIDGACKPKARPVSSTSFENERQQSCPWKRYAGKQQMILAFNQSKMHGRKGITMSNE